MENTPLKVESDSLYTLANTAGEQFYKIYYEAMDKRRHLVSKLYMDTAVLCWNGHAMGNIKDIQNFYTNLAQTTHLVLNVDSIPIPSFACNNQNATIVHVAGTIRLRTDCKLVSKPFTQSFILCQHEDNWKIVSDTMRTQDGLDDD